MERERHVIAANEVLCRVISSVLEVAITSHALVANMQCIN